MKLKKHRVSLSVSTRAILWLYEFFWILALPVALIRLFWKGRIQKGYRQHIAERLGFYESTLHSKKIIWVHAVSVGETRASAPLVNSLLEDGFQILLTHMTPTGRDTGAEVFSTAIANGQLQQAYLPYDISYLVAAFFKKFNIQLGLVMETEVWPNLVLTAAKEDIPLLLVNARLSERSARRVAQFGSAGTAIYAAFTQILAQTALDAKRYESLGLNNVTVTGNLKFDVEINAAQVDKALELRKLLPANTRLICAASTRDGEERIVMKAWLSLLEETPDLKEYARLLIVPRHPQRFGDVYQDLQSSHLEIVKRSQLHDPELAQAITRSAIVLGDSMGEMGFYYALSDVVVMGGSLQPLGGQNFIEACGLGRPIIFGEHTFNFQQASHDAVEQEAAIRIGNLEELTKAMKMLLENDLLRERMSANAIDFAGQHIGANQKNIRIIQNYLK